MKTGTPELLKFIKLQRRLQESRRGIIGLLEGLWLATARNCPTGDIGRFTNEEIAILVDWEGDPDALINALVDCKWIDRDDTHRLVVHDWAEHCPRYVRSLVARGKDKIEMPTLDNVHNTGPPIVANAVANTVPNALANTVPSVEANTKPSLAKPSLAKPNLTQQLASLRAAEFFALEAEGCQAVVRAANSLRKACPSMPRELVWQVAWIAFCIEPGFPKDLVDRLREGNVRKPPQYVRKAIRDELDRLGYTWDEATACVPEPTPEREVVR